MLRAWVLNAIPLALIGLLVAFFVIVKPIGFLSEQGPPVEEITFERVTFDDTGIHATVRASGSQPVVIAQVQVDGAYRNFAQTRRAVGGVFDTVRIDIAYPWIDGETHHLLLITSSGATFEHTVDVATAATAYTAKQVLGFVLIGLFMGIVPVSIGIAFYPGLRVAGATTIRFVLALTVGMLVFLLVDTIGEGLEFAAAAAPVIGARTLFWVAALVSLVLLLLVGRRGGVPPEGARLAFYIALGIGLHNLGEGLAVGAALANGRAALAAFLVIGFTLHNVTEGIGIAAPMAKRSVSLRMFAGLALLAGLPAVIGTLAGAAVSAPHWTALAFGLGAGAIAQVIVEVGAYLARTARRDGESWLAVETVAGGLAGMGVMYLTALLVQV